MNKAKQNDIREMIDIIKELAKSGADVPAMAYLNGLKAGIAMNKVKE